MTGETQNALALLVGVAALRLAATDAYLRYVKESLRPWLLIAGVLLVLLGVVGLLRDGRARRAARAEADAAAEEAAAAAPGLAHDDPEHDHDHGHAPAVAWLLALPVLAIFLVAPAPLGSFAARRADTRLAAPKAQFPPLPAAENGAVPLTLREYSLRVYYDDAERLKEQKFRLIGFVTPQGRDLMLTRFILSCCAADGTPIKVRLEDYPGVPPTADTWLEVEGTYVAPELGPENEVILTRPVAIKVTSARVVPEPKRPYEG